MNDKIVEFRYCFILNFIHLHQYFDIFQIKLDISFQLFCPCYTFACRLVICELRLASLFAILHPVNDKIIEFRYCFILNFIHLHQYFDMFKIKLDISFQLFCPCYTFACRLVICELQLASLFAILHLVNDKIIEFRYCFILNFIHLHQYFDIFQIKLDISFQLFCPCYTFACRLVICELRLASLFAILHLVNDKIIEFRYCFILNFIHLHRYFDMFQIKLDISFQLFCPCYTFACRLVICELQLASLFAILHLVNDKIIEFRYCFILNFIHLHQYFDIFQIKLDISFQLFCPCYTFACRLVICELRLASLFAILHLVNDKIIEFRYCFILNFIHLHRYFDMFQIKLDISFQLFCPCYTFACRLVICELQLASLFAILHLVNDKIIEFRYCFILNFIHLHQYFDIFQIKLDISFQLFCPCYTFACRLVICELRLASLFAILHLVNDKIIEFRYCFILNFIHLHRYFDMFQIKLDISFQLFCPCYTFACRLVICELQLASLFAILHLVNDKIIEFRYCFILNFIHLHQYFDIFQIKLDISFQLFCPCYTFDCRLVICELRLASLFAILHLVNDKIIEFRYCFILNFIHLHRYFDMFQIKLDISFQLFCPCYTFACRLVICELQLASLFAILHLVNDKIIEFRYCFILNFIHLHQYFDIFQIKLDISFQLFCPCYTFACRLVICELRLASLFAILHLVNDKIIEFRYCFIKFHSFASIF